MSESRDIHHEIEPLPRGMVCPKCQYEVSGAITRRCPECGRIIQVRDVFAHHASAGTRGKSVRLATLQIVMSLGVGLVSGLVFGLLSRDVAAGIASCVVLLVALCGPVAGGWLIAGLAVASSRSAWRLAWLRCIFWLHLSWLCTPAVALVAYATTFVNRRSLSDTARILLVLVVLGGFFGWIGVSIFGFARGEERWQRESDAMGLHSRLPRLAYSVLLGFTIVASILLSLVGACFFAGPILRFP